MLEVEIPYNNSLMKTVDFFQIISFLFITENTSYSAHIEFDER